MELRQLVEEQDAVMSPATEATMEVSSSSRGDKGGRSPGRRCASMDLPGPGGPENKRLWPPAAAISRARLASSWPFTSHRSGPGGASNTAPGWGGHAVKPALPVVVHAAAPYARPERTAPPPATDLIRARQARLRRL